MATTILHKSSATPGAVPTPEQLVPGEIAVNLADKKWYTKKTDGTIVCLNQLTVLDGGEITGAGIDGAILAESGDVIKTELSEPILF